jgi:outer membrane lipoprotein
MRINLATFVFIVFITGCAPAISQQARDRVTLRAEFSDILKDPQRLKGEVVLLGGKVITTTPYERGTELVILQLPLKAGLRPGTKATSEGRFLVQAGEFMDPAVYASDRLVTLVGEIAGVESRPLGQTVYHYPKLTLIEMKLWPEEEVSREPRFHFGFGVGTHF